MLNPSLAVDASPSSTGGVYAEVYSPSSLYSTFCLFNKSYCSERLFLVTTINVDMTFSGEECRLQTCRRLASQLFDSTLSTFFYADLTYCAHNPSELCDWKMI